ncbi:hypothetical protein Cassandra_0169 [Pseudomonas phage Cassandra]|nr:hypothetical protein Cassandra_0169 [Pseudomonas phage Cassandra]
MKVRYFHPINNVFEETVWDKPDIKNTEIEVKTKYVGVSNNDLNVIYNQTPYASNKYGCESVGIVTKVGSKITDVKVGDFVATTTNHLYSDFYNCKTEEYVKIPKCSPRYILEPIARSLNLITQNWNKFVELNRNEGKILILGSGFVASVLFTVLTKEHDVDPDRIYVVGSHNKSIFNKSLYNTLPIHLYDIVFDLQGINTPLTNNILNTNSLLVIGAAGKPTLIDLNLLAHKSVTINFPSPYNNKFYESLNDACRIVETKIFDPNKFWTKGYKRDTEWKSAFSTGINRPKHYNYGYIIWN